MRRARKGAYPTWVSQEDGTLVPVVQAYAYSKYVGHLKLTFNDDGTLNLVDVIRLVGYLFRTGAPAPAPFEECGVDPTTDALGCDSFPPCG